MASEDLPANGHGGPADPNKLARRKTLRAARKAFVGGLAPDEHRRLEGAVVAQLGLHLPPGIVAGYRAIGSEIGLAGVRHMVLFPEVADRLLTFRTAAGQAKVPDIVLVPLIAVDRRGTRLGQGGGYYDRALAALRAAGPVLAVGVAWDMQLADELPADPWDTPLDALATPSQWLTFNATSSMSAT